MWTRGLQLNPYQTAPQQFYTPVSLLTLGSFVLAFSLPLTTVSLPFAPQGNILYLSVECPWSGSFLTGYYSFDGPGGSRLLSH